MQKPSPEEAKILRMHGKSGFSAVSLMRMIFADCIWKQIFSRQRGCESEIPDSLQDNRRCQCLLSFIRH